MNQKEYELIATAINKAWGQQEIGTLAVEMIADVLEQDNPKFDRNKFLAGCGLEDVSCLHSFDDDDDMAICSSCGVIRATVKDNI